ncbi:NINE protein [Deinococcus oregonensis]|uniref:NINE protein n=1 Tax=Deinococcus oregonensis TaxID=1805970 RepID=A0ABV6B5D5_9DEIO
MTNDPNNPGPKPDASTSSDSPTSGNAPHWADSFDTRAAPSVDLGKHAETVPSHTATPTPSHTPYRSDDPFGQVTGGQSTPAPTAYASAPTHQPAPMGQPAPQPTSSQLWSEAQASVQSSVQGGLNQIASADTSTKKLIAGLLAIFLGSLGIHKFYLGMTRAGVIMLAATIGGWFLGVIGSLIIVGAVFFLIPLAMSILGLIEGILYLTKSDAEFDAKYVRGKQEWL